MWKYQDCVDEFARRRKGNDTKKTHRNVYMRHESGDNYSMFIFKMYHTDIVKVRMDLNTRKATHIVQHGGYSISTTTRERIRDISGVHLCNHSQSPTWRPEAFMRVSWTERHFKLGDKIVNVWGVPFTDGMTFENGHPIGDFTREQFKILDPVAELARKRLLRPWLEAVKVAVGLSYGAKLQYEESDRRFASEILGMIKRNAPVDMAPVLGMVHYEWSRREVSARHDEEGDTGKEVYKEVTDFLFRETRREVPEIMVTGYLLDVRN